MLSKAAIVLGIALVGSLTIPLTVRGEPSIFDDDWKPPAESARPTPAAPAKPPPDEPATAAPRIRPRAAPEPVRPEPEPVKPEPGTVKPATPAPAVPAGPARSPVPTAAAVAAAEKEIQEVFKAEYAGKKAAEQIAFSRTLLSEAQQSKNDPATLYVLLRDARDLASAGGEPEVALEAACGMRDNFVIDARAAEEMEHATLTSAIGVMCDNPATLASYDVSHRASDLGMEMAEMDLAEYDYPNAAKIAVTAETAARKTKDWEYPTRVHIRVNWLQAAEAQFELDRGSIAALRTNPNDPAAALAAGRFYFAYVDRPDLGLPWLARGSDAALKALAMKDLAANGPTSTPKLLIAAAQAWDDGAKSELAPLKDAMQRRALSLYDQACPNLQGLEQAAAQKREEALRVSRVSKGLTVEFFRGEGLASRAFARNDKSILGLPSPRRKLFRRRKHRL